MKRTKYIKELIGILALLMNYSCDNFVDIEAPDHKIISEVVYNNDETAVAAMQGIYNQLVVVSYSNGWTDSITMLTELYSDNLECIRTTNLSLMEFQQNEIQPGNTRNKGIWSSAYQIIYQTNSLLEGISNSNKLSFETKSHLEGEAKFVRAFTYFYLVNLYGEVPLLLTTDYRTNSLASREPLDSIYQQIKKDLEDATILLESNYKDGERTNVNRFASMSLLARISLYQNNWQSAEYWSSQVISQSNLYQLLLDPDEVFLKNSREAIWQISPLGKGSSYTFEAYTLIPHSFIPTLTVYKLTNNLIQSFSSDDKRFIHWVKYHSGLEINYANKYKKRENRDDVSEYSMVLRLAEQFLIRAEARTMQDKFTEAIADIDKIRERAGLDNIASLNLIISKDELIDIIIKERRKELFTEWGHRWLDLKRTDKASGILKIDNSTWDETDVLFPIPEDERMKNPNLDQNNGY